MVSRKRSIWLFVIGTALVGSLEQCVRDEGAVPALPVFSSLEPLDIPLRQREAQLKRGNLVKNGGFEEGRFYELDSLNTRYNISGWQKVGDHVFWVDTRNDSLYAPDESRGGVHAIKISRDRADETTGQGEGVISDYIRVIPGNYRLNYDIRLENIYPNQGRRGTRIYDAVDIRVLYYDKNKLMIDGSSYDPYGDIIVDNSFKAHQFSSFWFIEEFGWADVRGRTGYHPFADGDIPDDAKYVRIFAGLKGTGTMWIDNIEYRYTPGNFSPRERTEPLFDTSFALTDMLIPAPRMIEPGQTFEYFFPNDDSLEAPLIHLPGRPSAATLEGARLLRSRLEKIFEDLTPDSTKHTIPFTYYLSDEEIESGRLIFSLGESRHYARNKHRTIQDTLNGREQAYFIQEDSTHGNLVYLKGTDPAGDYYAAATACQLLEEEAFRFHRALVIDYPAYPDRPFVIGNWANRADLDDDLESVKQLQKWKMNRVYISYLLPEEQAAWYEPGDLYRTGIRLTGQACRRSGFIDMGQMLNPYYHLRETRHVDSLSEEEADLWKHSSQRSIRQMLHVYQLGLKAGASSIMLCTNDFMPVTEKCDKHFTLYSEVDIRKLKNLQNAHAYLINRLDNWLNSYYPRTRIEFMPPWYNNEFLELSCGEGEQYLTGLVQQIPQDIVIAWSGPSRVSRSLDDADMKRYHELIGREPMLVDHSLAEICAPYNQRIYPSHYPGKIRLCNLFAPFHPELTQDYPPLLRDEQLFINYLAGSHIARIKYATAADYLWNPGKYNPDFSLFKILVKQFGSEAARELLLFNEAYYNLESICLRIEQNGLSNRMSRLGEDLIRKMDYHIDIVTLATTDDPSLALELHGHKNRLIDRFNKQLDEEDVILISPGDTSGASQ